LRAVSRGHDNELYVILADLLELEASRAAAQAVRVARLRAPSGVGDLPVAGSACGGVLSAEFKEC